MPDLTAKNQIELVDSGYKIKEHSETKSKLDNKPNFTKNIQINHETTVSDQ